MSVSCGMLAETLERQGKREEAARVKGQALKLAAQVPKGMQRFEEEGDEKGGVGRAVAMTPSVADSVGVRRENVKSMRRGEDEGGEEKDELA